eukprot:TRINITY_DN70637_c0_g1_i1.p1 TRINITY_DN70637_c0_g1~~TRINITY_DN70637_c0_g1_i1.p1  ORF type:complete len:548 (+),score=208.44 TRINITY_DN70637_c0_g1_i1:96-1646(+)
MGCKTGDAAPVVATADIMGLMPEVIGAATRGRGEVGRREFGMMINGELVAGSGSRFPVVDPSSEEALATCPEATPEEVSRAVEAAAAAQPAWAATPIADRRTALLAWGDAIVREAPGLAALLCAEQGKPLGPAAAEVLAAVLWLRHMAKYEMPVKVLEKSEDCSIEVHHRPIGVVAALAPWNVPVTMAVTKITPAVLTGNAVVLKPSEFTPLTTLWLGELAARCFPPGVVNVVSGHGPVGAALVEHPLTAKITFTGSTATGTRILAAAAPFMKRVTLEAGGNDAAIVRGDVDVADVAPKVLGASLRNSGQVCMAVKRVYVHDSIYDQFCEAVAAVSRDLRFGPGFERDSQFGPLNNEMQLRKVTELVEDARAKGATVLSGGERIPRKGYFYPSTVLRDIPPEARIIDEEQFGPVLPVMRFSDDAEALRLANQSPYGLCGSVWTKDLERGYEMASQLRVGTAWVNTHLLLSIGHPFGGFKLSGLGREFSNEAVLASFTEQQVVHVRAQPTKAMGSQF